MFEVSSSWQVSHQLHIIRSRENYQANTIKKTELSTQRWAYRIHAIDVMEAVLARVQAQLPGEVIKHVWVRLQGKPLLPHAAKQSTLL